ncbi:transmembrane protein 223 isoform X1 [Temnothorax curvispinosus]|uniref:Transmembrane protein 223 isoform X1 n=1 Tax=Temnothorax curvispinosus TaxID=300111 RepID=A0A6J1QS05_9HYME|nr:transmembrane protein 223 isoform X1 [Temnothorax curvispinosus]
MLSLIFKHFITPKTVLTQMRSVHGIAQKYFMRDENISSATMAIKMFLMRHVRLSNGATRPTSFLRPNGLLQNVLIQRRQMSQLDVNTNVQNNVVLYKLEKSAYYRYMRIFSIGQLFGWSVLAFYTYKPSFWDIFYTDIKFKEFCYNHMFRLSTFICAILAGPIMFLVIYATCARSIKYIILNKGGETLSITTFHMRKNKSTISIPVDMVRCTADRTTGGGVLPIKIQNRSFYYLIDKSGTFVNPKLFDYVTG